MSKKQELINDIQNLLNSYKDGSTTQINPALLEFMDENELKAIIDSLLQQKENLIENNQDWLNQFKKHKEN